jgi:hypothetical protein
MMIRGAMARDWRLLAADPSHNAFDILVLLP